MSKKKITYEEKLKAVQRYKGGEGSQASILREVGVKGLRFSNGYKTMIRLEKKDYKGNQTIVVILQKSRKYL